MLIGWTVLAMIVVGAEKAPPSRIVSFEAHTKSTSGAPVPAGDVLVVVRPPGGVPTSGLTDAKGQLILTSIPLGPVTVSFGPPNCTLKSETYTIGESTDPIQLSILPTSLLRVEVSAASFAGHSEVPLVGAAVTVRRGPRDAAMYLTDASGVASTCVEPGVTYDIRVDYDGMATAARYEVRLEAGGRLDVPIRLVPLRVEN